MTDDPTDEERIEPRRIASFGFGCIQFVPKNPQERFDDFHAFTKALRASLGNIAAIQNLEIEALDEFGNFNEGISAPFPLLSEGQFPSFAGMAGVTLDVSMKVKIPERTQKFILKVDEDADWTPYPEFSVFLSHEYTLPIMIVALPEESEGNPSSCVRLAREFLSQEFANNSGCQFLLDTLGPSPFHADFRFFEKHDHKDSAYFERIKKRGYDEINFFMRAGSDFADAYFELLNHNLLSDFDTFYFVVQCRNQITNSWYACLGNIKIYQQDWQRLNRVRRVIASIIPKFSVYEFVAEIADFRLLSASVISEVTVRLRKESLLKDSPIWHEIKQEQRTFPTFEVDSLEKFVDYVDRSHARYQLIANALVAAIVGGVVSALVRLWLK